MTKNQKILCAGHTDLYDLSLENIIGTTLTPSIYDLFGSWNSARVAQVGGSGGDPVVLGMTGPVALTSSTTSGKFFDLDGDGHQEQVGWVAPGTELLADDLNGDGKINNGRELIGNVTVPALMVTVAGEYEASENFEMLILKYPYFLEEVSTMGL